MKLFKINDPLKSNNNVDNNAKKEVVLGIDLGTTNSVVAVFVNEKIQIINIDKKRLAPSIVAILNNEVIIGSKALEILQNSDNNNATVFRSIKRLMGKCLSDAKDEIKELNLSVEQNNNNKVIKLAIKKESNSNLKTLTPEEISGFILKYLKEEAEKFLDTKITKAVITVPAYFNETARIATKNAAYIAGLEVLRLINEPTAAALAYGLDDGISGTYLIYDLGGGTFDVSVLQLNNGVFRVVATKGDLALGGDNLDFLIAKELIKQIQKKYNVNIETIPNELILQAKVIKEELSIKDEVNSTIRINKNNYNTTFNQEDLKEAIFPLLNKTIKICKEALKDAELLAKDLKGIVLVGGSTRIPFLHSLIKDNFKIDPYCNLNPDEVVAVGAAYQAANLNGDIKKSLLLDITPLSLGIETYGGVVEKIIFRNTPIPVSKSQEFTTFKDNQTNLSLHILQGERELVKDNKSLAKFVLNGIPALPAGVARIEVNFTIDADGLLIVTAKEKNSNISQSVEIKPSFGLEFSDIKNMILDSIANAEQDIEKKLLENSKTEALHLINITKHALEEDNDLISKQENIAIKEAILQLENAAKSNNKDKIKELQQKLTLATESFAEKRMNKAIKKSLEGKDINKL